MARTELNLKAAPPMFKEQIRQAFEEGDAEGFVAMVPNHDALAFVFDNARPLRERGIYEPALLMAYIGTRTNHSHWPPNVIRFMFDMADRAKLRAAGDPIPAGELTLYRGIAGRGARRRRLGYSWTDSLTVACWFALRMQLEAPAVLKAVVRSEDVLACVSDRDEHEYVVRPPAARAVRMSVETMRSHAGEHKRVVERSRMPAEPKAE